MAQDVFDTLTETQIQSGDIFDSVAEESSGDIFDSVAPPEPKSTTPATDQAVAQTAGIAEDKAAQASGFLSGPIASTFLKYKDAGIPNEVAQAAFRAPLDLIGATAVGKVAGVIAPNNPVTQVQEGIMDVGGDLLASAVTPQNVALLAAGGALGKFGTVLLSAGFEAHALRHAPEQYNQFRDALSKGDYQNATRIGGNLVVGLGLPPVAVAIHGVRGKPVEKTAAKPSSPEAMPVREGLQAPVESALTPEAKLSAPLEEPATIPKPLEAAEKIEGAEQLSNEQPQIEQPVQKGGEITSAVEPGMEGAIAEIQRRNAPDDPYAQYRTAPAERNPKSAGVVPPEETGIAPRSFTEEDFIQVQAERAQAGEKPLRFKRQIEESTGLRPVTEINETIDSVRKSMVTKSVAFTERMKGMEQGGKLGSAAAKEQLRVADKWLEADRDAIRTELLSFSRQLPLSERAKFLPAISSAMKRPSILSKDPGVMYRRAEDVLNRMTEKVYDFKKSEVVADIEKILARTEKTETMTVPEREAIRERGKTFAALKDKMSLDMVEAMRARMKEIEQQGRDVFALDETIRQEKVNATLREIQTQGARKIDTPDVGRLALGETESAWGRRVRQLKQSPSLIKHFNLSLTPMDWLIQTFDKAPQGAIYRTMKLPIDVRYGEWLDSSHVFKQRLSKIAQRNQLKAGNFDRVYANAELRQEGGYENLKSLGYSEKEITSARTLSRPELEYLREADKINNELFPVLKDVLAKSFHQEINKVEGYFPRQRDWDYYNTLSIEEGKFARAMNRTNTEKGFTILRTGATTKNITNAHQVMMNHIDDVLYHIKMGPEIRRVADVVKTPEFAGNVGTWGQEVFSDWVDVLSRNGGISNGRRMQSLDVLRKNVGAAQLAFRLTTTALQPLSLIQGMAVVSPKSLALALDGIGSKARRDFMLNNFPEIRSRVGDDPAYSDYGGSSIRDRLARGGFKAIATLDRFAAIAVGEAAYRDSLAKRGVPFSWDKVDPIGVQDAQLAVRKTQSSAYPKDVPLAISRGNFSGNASVDKAIFQFQNFLVNKWALTKNGALQMGIAEKSPRAGARIMTFLILGTIAEQLSRDGIRRAIQATIGTSDQQDRYAKKASDKSYALRIAEKAAVDFVTSIPIVSNIAGMARYQGSGVPVVDTLGNVIEGATKGLTGKKGSTKATGTIRAGQAVGALAGLPTGQVGDLAVQAVRANMKEPKKPKKGKKPKFSTQLQ